MPFFRDIYARKISLKHTRSLYITGSAIEILVEVYTNVCIMLLSRFFKGRLSSEYRYR